MNHKPQIKKLVSNLLAFYRIIFVSLIFYIIFSSFLATNSEYIIKQAISDSYLIEVLQVLTLLVISAISYYWPGRIIETARKTLDITRKLTLYRQAIYLRLSLMNLAGLFVAVGFLFSGNINLIYLQAMIVLFYVVYKPSTARVVLDLGIKYPEKEPDEE